LLFHTISVISDKNLSLAQIGLPATTGQNHLTRQEKVETLKSASQVIPRLYKFLIIDAILIKLEELLGSISTVKSFYANYTVVNLK